MGIPGFTKGRSGFGAFRGAGVFNRRRTSVLKPPTGFEFVTTIINGNTEVVTSDGDPVYAKAV